MKTKTHMEMSCEDEGRDSNDTSIKAKNTNNWQPPLEAKKKNTHWTSKIYKQLIQYPKSKQSNWKMDRRPAETFIQRGHASSQQTHEKMCNIVNHQGNANQNHTEISPHICQHEYHQKEHK